MKKHAILSWTLMAAFGGGASALPPNSRLVTLLPSLAFTTHLATAPDGRVFLSQKDGPILVYQNGALLPAPWLTIPVDNKGERGVFGLDFDKNFSVNHFVYVFYVAKTPSEIRLSRFTDSRGQGTNEAVLFHIPVPTNSDPAHQPFTHYSGALRVGPDGDVYFTVGDINNPTNSQDLTLPYGKVYRIRPDNGAAPSDNPFVNAANGADPRFFAYGIRNTYGLAWHPNGHLYGTDNNETYDDELNLLASGGNYGWDLPAVVHTDPAFTQIPGVTYPIAYLSDDYSVAPTGITAYSGSAFPSLNGSLLFVRYLQRPAPDNFIILSEALDTANPAHVTGSAGIVSSTDADAGQPAIGQGLDVTTTADGGILFTDVNSIFSAGKFTNVSSLRRIESIPGPAALLSVAMGSTPVKAGVPFSEPVIVTVADATGRVLTGYSGPVTVALSTGIGAALSGTATINAAHGMAVFNGLSISTPGKNYALTATSNGFSTTGMPFTVNAAAHILTNATVADGIAYYGDEAGVLYAERTLGGEVPGFPLDLSYLLAKPVSLRGRVSVYNDGSGTFLYVTTDKGDVLKLRSNGQVQWSTVLFNGTTGAFNWIAPAPNGNVYVALTTDRGPQIFLLDGSLGYRITASPPLAFPGAALSAPAVQGGKVYVGVHGANASDGALGGDVMALDAIGLTPLSTGLAVQEGVLAPPFVVNGSAYIGTLAGNVYKVNGSTMALDPAFDGDGKAELGEAIPGGAFSDAAGRLYVATQGGKIYALDPATGAGNATPFYDTGLGTVFINGLVINRTGGVLAFGAGNRLYTVPIANPSAATFLTGSAATGAIFDSTPAYDPVSNRFFATNEDGQLYNVLSP